MADLKTTYKDDVLNTSANEKRKYNMITNEDGTVSLVDVTDYSQVGDSFGAADINATNEKVNELNTNLAIYNEETDKLDIYFNGVLVGSLPCYFKLHKIYDYGIEYDLISAFGSYSTYKKNSGNITLVSTRAGYAWLSTSKRIDVTNYNKLVFSMYASATNWGGVSVYLTTLDSRADESLPYNKTIVYANSDGTVTAAKQEYEINVSGATGDYYIAISVNGSETRTGSATLYEMHLE